MSTAVDSGLNVQESPTQVTVSDEHGSVVFHRLKDGVYNCGQHAPETFITARHDHLLSAGLSDSILRVIAAVSRNEGHLDAVNTYDNSFLSFGMLQWTAGAGTDPGELAALLKRLQREDAAVFQGCFAQYGLTVGTANEVNGFLALEGKELHAAADKEVLRSPAWAFRFQQAGCQEAVQQAQIGHAAARIGRFYRNPGLKPAGYFVADLLTSQYGVALVYDQHVNRPGHVQGCLQQAFQQFIAQNPAAGDPAKWDDAAEAAFIQVYLAVRAAYGNPPMTDSAKRAAALADCVKSGRLLSSRGSFQ